MGVESGFLNTGAVSGKRDFSVYSCYELDFLGWLCKVAERGGFEPPVELLTLQRFSKPPPSATRPSLHGSFR